MYSLIPSKEFIKGLHRLRHSGKFNEPRLEYTLQLLKNGESLPKDYRDHQLHGDLKHVRECHIAGDILLLYTKNDSLHEIILNKIGTHHQIYGN